jgi:hypothetical protein
MTYEEARELYQRHEVFAHIAGGMFDDDCNGDMSRFDTIAAFSDEVMARQIVDCQNIVESTPDDTGLLMLLIARGA